MLRVSLFVHDERGLLSFQHSTTRHEFTKRCALFLQSTERIEDGELLGGMKKRLMIVRPVHVHEPLTDAGENIQRGRRAVDELTIRPRTRERTLEDELVVITRLKSVLIEKAFERCAELFHVEHRLHRAGITAAADERAIRALTEHEIERADDDGFARARLAGDDVATGLEFQRQVAHEGEVFDAQRRQHGFSARRICGWKKV